MTQREKIAGIIRALRAKTTANGCTEDEAIAAAAKLAELLARYNMTIDEAEMRASPFTKHTESHEDHVGDRLWKIAAAVSKLTGASYWQSARGVFPVRINFFGFAHEVDIAAYLCEICGNAMKQQQARILNGAERAYTSRQRAKLYPFLDGMADRLATRLLEMIPPAPIGTGLVVLRDSLIEQALKDAGIELEDMTARQSRDREEAYLHGQTVADKVALNAALRGAETALQIASQRC